jgi:hypothetical protein
VVAITLPEVALAGRFGFEINQTGAAVDETMSVGGVDTRLELAAGALLRFAAEDATLTVLGQTLSGDFVLTSGADAVNLEVRDAALSLGGGLAVATVNQAQFTSTATGLAGSFDGAVALGIDGVAFNAGLRAELDTTGPAPFVRLVGTGVELDVLGQTLAGDFLVESRALADGTRALELAVANLALAFGPEDSPYVNITNGSGALVLTPAGLAGSLSLSAAIDVPDLLSATSAVTLQINTGAEAVKRTLQLGGASVTLDLPGGPFFRVALDNASVTLDIGGSHTLAGDFAFEQRPGSAGPVTIVAISGLTITFAGQVEPTVSEGEGVLVIAAAGVAGFVSGRGQLAVPGAAAAATVLVRINSTGGEVDETIDVGGGSLAVVFGAGEENLFDLAVSDLTLNIADFVTIEGTVVFTSVTLGDGTKAEAFAGSDLTLFVGQGPLYQDPAAGAVSPLARGLLISNATVGLLRFADGVFAVDASGTVALIGLANVSISGTVRVRVNQSALAFSQAIALPGGAGDVTVAFAAGETANGATPFSLVRGDLEIDVAGQVVEGEFTFQRLGDGTLFVAGDDIEMAFGEPGSPVVTLEQGSGVLLIGPGGIAGDLGGTVNVLVPDVDFTGGFRLQLNSGAAAVDFAGPDGSLLKLPGGPYFRLSGLGVALETAGQSLGGDFLIEQAAVAGGTVTRVTAANVSVGLGDGTTDFVSVTNGRGALLLGAGGLAGELSAEVAFNGLGAVDFSGRFSVAINNGGAPVLAQLPLAGGGFATLDLPGGPFLRVAGLDVALAVNGGELLRGDFAFESTGTGTSAKVLAAVRNVNLSLRAGGDELLALRDASGLFLLGNGGAAGRLGGTLVANLPGATLTGTLALEFNQFATPITETLVLGTETVELDLDEGPLFRLAGTGLELNVLGQTLSGDFGFEQRAGALKLTIENAELNLGGGLLVLSAAAARFDFLAGGMRGSFSGAAVLAVPGVAFQSNLDVTFDTTSPLDRFIRVEATGIDLDIAGQTLRGNFLIEQRGGASGSLKIAASDISVSISAGGDEILSISDGEGQFVVRAGGVAAAIRIGGLSLDAGLGLEVERLSIEVNTGIEAVRESFRLGGRDFLLALPAGPFLRVVALGAKLDIAGNELSGNFFFQQGNDANGDPVVLIGADRVRVAVEFNGQGATLTDGSGGLVFNSGGFAGVLGGRADLALGPVKAGGRVLLRINKTGGEVDEVIELGGNSIAIKFGPSETDVFAVAISELSLNIGDFVTIEGSIAFENRTLTGGQAAEVFGGTELKVFIGRGPAYLDNGGLNPLAQGVLLSGATIGLVKVGETYALSATGTVGIIGIDGITLGGTATVRFNDTGLAINESIAIPEKPAVAVSFADGGYSAEFSATAVVIDVLGQRFEGGVSFDKVRDGPLEGAVRIGFDNVSLELGDVVTVSDFAGGIILFNGGVAADVSAAVQVAVPGLVFGGERFRLKLNTLAVPVNQTFVVGAAQFAINIRAGPFLEVAGEGVTLTVAGQTLSGSFAFRDGTVDGVAETVLVMSNVTLALGSDDAEYVSFRQGSGVVLLTAAGLAGELGGTVVLNLPDTLEFSADFKLAINDTNARVQRDFTIGGVSGSLDLPAGPYARVSAFNAQLRVGGQLLAGDFGFEQSTLAGGGKVVRLTVANASIDMAGVIGLTAGQGFFLISDAGLAGTVQGTVNFALPGVDFDGTFGFQINQTGAAVSESVVVNGTPVALNVPAGPFFRFYAENAGITVNGQRLGGNFAIQRSSPVRLKIENVGFDLGGGLVSLSNGSADLAISPAGIAGTVSGTVGLNVPGVSFSGQLVLAIDTTDPLNRFIRVEGNGVELVVAGQRLAGDFKIVNQGGNTRVTVANGLIDLGGGVVVASGIAGSFDFTAAGTVADLLVGNLAVTAGDVSVSGSFRLFIDTTVVGGPVVRVSGGDPVPVSISIAGQSIGGRFTFEQVPLAGGGTQVKATLSDGTLKLGPAGAEFVSITAAEGLLLLRPGGAAGALEIGGFNFAVPGVAVTASNIRVEVSTFATGVSETFQLPGGATTLDLPAGPFVRVVVLGGQLELLGLDVGGTTPKLGGDFFFDQRSLPGGGSLTRIAAAKVTAAVEFGGASASLSEGGGGIVIIREVDPVTLAVTREGVAGMLSGVASAAIGGVGAGGGLLVRFNNSGGEVNETVEFGGNTVAVRFTPEEGQIFALSISGLTINVADLVTIEGDVSFVDLPDRKTLAGTNLTLFIGQGPAYLESGELNPLARGFLVTNATVGAIRFTLGTPQEDDDTWALDATGTVQVVGIPDVTLGGTLRLRINSSDQLVDSALTIPGTDNQVFVKFGAGEVAAAPGQPFSRIGGTGLTLSVGGQSLRGDFEIHKVRHDNGTPANTADDTDALRLTGSSIEVSLGGGAVTLAGGHADLLVLPAGVAGAAGGTVGINVPGVAFTGNLNFVFNTSALALADTFVVARDQLGAPTRTLAGLPAGPYVRFEGNGLSLNVLGQTLTGNFLVERVNQAGGAVTRISATQVILEVGSGGAPLVTLDNGNGVFLLTAGGLAGELSGGVTLSPALGFNLGVGELTLAINTTGAAVAAAVPLPGGGLRALNLPAGPYVRVEARGVALDIAGQTITGNVAFQQESTAGADGLVNRANPLDPVNADNGKVVYVVFTAAEVKLGPAGAPVASLSDGSGFFLLREFDDNGTPRLGLAGRLSGTLALTVPGVSLTGNLSFQINQTGAAVAESFSIAGQTIELSLPAGPYVRVAGEGIELAVLGQTLSADVAVTRSGAVTRLEFANAGLNLGGGVLVVSNGSGNLTVGPTGVHGSLTVTPSLNLPGVTLDATSLTLALDTRTDQPRFLRVEGSAVTLELAGQSLKGDFAFEQSTRATGETIIKVAASNVALAFGDGTTNFVDINNAAGQLVITPDGIAGRLRFAGNPLNVPGLTLSVSSVDIEVSTLAYAVNETLVIGGVATALSFAPGPFVRVAVTGAEVGLGGLSAGGSPVSLRGDFLFDQSSRTNAAGVLDDGHPHRGGEHFGDHRVRRQRGRLPRRPRRLRRHRGRHRRGAHRAGRGLARRRDRRRRRLVAAHQQHRRRGQREHHLRRARVPHPVHRRGRQPARLRVRCLVLRPEPAHRRLRQHRGQCQLHLGQRGHPGRHGRGGCVCRRRAGNLPRQRSAAAGQRRPQPAGRGRPAERRAHRPAALQRRRGGHLRAGGQRHGRGHRF